MTPTASPSRGWGRSFDPNALASLELRMWKAYYRRERLRLLTLLVEANRAQAGVGLGRAVAAAFCFTRAAVRFGRAGGDYERFEGDIERGYRWLGVTPADAPAVARNELRWWVVRREIGLAAGEAAGHAISRLYASLYNVPEADVAEAGRLRGLAAEVRDRGATADPDGPAGRGSRYWPEVAQLLRDSYAALHGAVARDGAPSTKAAASLATRTAPAPTTAANQYRFLTEWRLPATREEILSILGDAAALPDWWPSVYLDAVVVEAGDDAGLGRVVRVWTKGWLPYTLHWQFEVTRTDPPEGFEIRASGDFVGRGIWSLREADAGGARTRETVVTYDWEVLAEKGILRRFSFLFRPIFAANHRWAMARGEASLRLELARRRAAGDPLLLAAIPDPPGPTVPHPRRRRGQDLAA